MGFLQQNALIWAKLHVEVEQKFEQQGWEQPCRHPAGLVGVPLTCGPDLTLMSRRFSEAHTISGMTLNMWQPLLCSLEWIMLKAVVIMGGSCISGIFFLCVWAAQLLVTSQWSHYKIVSAGQWKGWAKCMFQLSLLVVWTDHSWRTAASWTERWEWRISTLGHTWQLH